MVIGPNGNSIYLPAEGYYDSEVANVQESGELGHYIACTHDYFHPSSGDSYYLYASSSDILRFDSAEVRPLAYCSDCGYTDGFSIRPVWSERDATTSVVESLRAHADSSVWHVSAISDPASFPSGEEALNDFLKQQSSPIEGVYFRHATLLADCIIESDGAVKLQQISQDKYFDLDDEKTQTSLHNKVPQIIQAMPAWTPGQRDGKNIRVRLSIPITFTSLPQRSQSHVSVADLAANPLGISTIDWHSSRHKLFKSLQKLDPGLKTEKHRLFGFLQGHYSCYDPISEIEINYEKNKIYCTYRISCKSNHSAEILAETIQDDITSSGLQNVSVSCQFRFDTYYVEILVVEEK